MVEKDKPNVDFEEIIQPYTYLKTQTQGKGFRNRLLEVFNIYYCISVEDLSIIQEFIDILHNSSLLVDDVEDDGTVRRGKTCAHRIYGVAHTINAGNLMYFKAWEKLMKLQVDGLSKVFVDSMIKLHVGQGTELCWRNAKVCPSEEEYLQMVVGKTGELFRLGVRVMACMQESRVGSGKPDNDVTGLLEQYCDILGMIYQIKNDLENLQYEEDAAEEGLDTENFAHDLKEGKYSLPILYWLRKKGASDTGWDGEKDLTSFENRVEIAQEIRASGGMKYSLNKMIELKQQGLDLSRTVSKESDPNVAQLGKRLAKVLSAITQ